MIFLIQQIIFTEKYVAHKNNDKWVFLYPNLQMINRSFFMDKHIEKAMQLRSNAMCPNCAETIMMTYADELGLSESQMKALGTNFG